MVRSDAVLRDEAGPATLLFGDRDGVYGVPVAPGGGPVSVPGTASGHWPGASVDGVAVIDDLDQDGLPEVFARDRVQVWLFSPEAPGPLADSPWRFDTELRGASGGDFDGDWVGDLVVTTWDEVWIFAGPVGMGVLSRADAAVREERYSSSLTPVAVADLDGDGRDDAVFSSDVFQVRVLSGGGL